MGLQTSNTESSEGPKTPKKTKSTGATSTFFAITASPSKKTPTGAVSVVQFPPSSSEMFGLIQEELAHRPFQLIMAVILLNKTRASMAIPVFRSIATKWPDAQALSSAKRIDLLTILKPLGLQLNRTNLFFDLAKDWLEKPPTKGRRYRTKGYPTPDDTKKIKPDEILADHDPRRGAFEVGHFTGLGPYGWDSWRIFCRDELRGLASGFNGEGAADGFEPEWKRCQPHDKELRAFLKWLWLKEDILWNPITGEKVPASQELKERAMKAEVLSWDEEIGLLNASPARKENKHRLKMKLSRTVQSPGKATEKYIIPMVGEDLDTQRR